MKVEIHDHFNSGRSTMIDIFKTNIYRFSKMDVINLCSNYVARNMISKPIIKPIVDYRPNNRYIADIIYFRYYKNVNDSYSYLFFWLIVFRNSHY